MVNELSWQELNDQLMHMSEEQIKAALMEEYHGERRPARILRIHGRLNVLRAIRERLELIGGTYGGESDA